MERPRTAGPVYQAEARSNPQACRHPPPPAANVRAVYGDALRRQGRSRALGAQERERRTLVHGVPDRCGAMSLPYRPMAPSIRSRRRSA